MKSKVIVTPTEFEVTLSTIELLHVEAALDAFTNLGESEAKEFFGKHESVYVTGVADKLFIDFNCLRNQVRLP